MGKTSLAQLLAERINAKAILEETEENPFLLNFYKDPGRFAFQTQIYFLLRRFQRQEEINQAFNDFFFHYTETPLLVINASDIDFVHVPSDLDELVLEIERMEKGTKYYVPLGSRR